MSVETSIINDRGSLFVCDEIIDDKGRSISAKIIRAVTAEDLATIPFHKYWGNNMLIPAGVIFNE